MSKGRLPERIIVTLLGVLFAALYLCIPAFLLYTAYDGLRVISFGSLWGSEYEQVSCRVVSARELNNPGVHAMQIEVAYTVHGEGSFTSNASGITGDSTSWAWDLRPGDQAECYVLKGSPEEAFIMNGTRRAAWMEVLLGIPAALLLIALAWVAFRRFR